MLEMTSGMAVEDQIPYKRSTIPNLMLNETQRPTQMPTFSR